MTNFVFESLSKTTEIKSMKTQLFSCVKKYFFLIVTINTYLKNTEYRNTKPLPRNHLI